MIESAVPGYGPADIWAGWWVAGGKRLGWMGAEGSGLRAGKVSRDGSGAAGRARWPDEAGVQIKKASSFDEAFEVNI